MRENFSVSKTVGPEADNMSCATDTHVPRARVCARCTYYARLRASKYKKARLGFPSRAEKLELRLFEQIDNPVGMVAKH